MITMDISRVGG